MGYYNFYFIKKILQKIFSKKFLIFIIIFLLLFIISNNVFAVDTVNDIEYQILQQQKNKQDDFALYCLKPFFNQSPMWTDELKPIWDAITRYGMNVLVGVSHPNTGNVESRYQLWLYKNSTRQFTDTYTSIIDNTQHTIRYYEFSGVLHFTHNFYSDNSGATTVETLTAWTMPACLEQYKSDLMFEFYKLYSNYGTGYNDYSGLLTAISNYLDDINTTNEDILTNLETITSSLSSIQQNTSTNYSQQISQISGKIDDILDDNQEIISQNDEMIQQQEEINQNLEDINETIKDDSIDSQASDLPSATIDNPTESGLNNIFTSIYNAFCTGSAQDIVFPIPFTGKNITLSPYYVSDMLNNNGATWVYTLIQAFWGYLIGRYIIKDISRKITKMKSGDIENIQNTNIKEDML